MTIEQLETIAGVVVGLLAINPILYKIDSKDNFNFIGVWIGCPIIGYILFQYLDFYWFSRGVLYSMAPIVILCKVDLWKYIPSILAFVWKYTVIFSKFALSLISKKSETKPDYRQAEPIEIKPQETKRDSEREATHKRKSEEMQNLFDKIDKF